YVDGILAELQQLSAAIDASDGTLVHLAGDLPPLAQGDPLEVVADGEAPQLVHVAAFDAAAATVTADADLSAFRDKPGLAARLTYLSQPYVPQPAALAPADGQTD